MGTKSIGVYDHDRREGATPGVLPPRFEALREKWRGRGQKPDAEITVLPERREDEAVAELSGFDVVVCHCADATWDALIASAEAGRVLVRTSRDGMPHLAGQRRGAFCLYLAPPHQDVTTDDWEKILEDVLEDAKLRDLVSGNVPDNLRRFFAYQLTYLTTLLLLCQGFLASWAEAHPGKVEQIRTGTDAAAPPDLRALGAALRQMGWLGLDDELRRSLPQDAGRRYSTREEGVQNIAWWDLFSRRQDAAATLAGRWQESLGKELGSTRPLPGWITGQRPGDPEGLVDLIRRGVVDDPAVVARAYLAAGDELERWGVGE